jgi:hypothetical protein
VKRPCERAWRDILEWAWSRGVEEFTRRDLLREDVIRYRGDKSADFFGLVVAASDGQAGLLTRLARGKGRRASLYPPISPEESSGSLESAS